MDKAAPGAGRDPVAGTWGDHGVSSLASRGSSSSLTLAGRRGRETCRNRQRMPSSSRASGGSKFRRNAVPRSKHILNGLSRYWADDQSSASPRRSVVCVSSSPGPRPCRCSPFGVCPAGRCGQRRLPDVLSARVGRADERGALLHCRRQTECDRHLGARRAASRWRLSQRRGRAHRRAWAARFIHCDGGRGGGGSGGGSGSGGIGTSGPGKGGPVGTGLSGSLTGGSGSGSGGSMGPGGTGTGGGSGSGPGDGSGRGIVVIAASDAAHPRLGWAGEPSLCCQLARARSIRGSTRPTSSAAGPPIHRQRARR